MNGLSEAIALPNATDDPNQGLQGVFFATWIAEHQNVDLGLFDLAHELLRGEFLVEVRWTATL